MEHDSFSTEQLQQIRRILLDEIHSLIEVLQSNSAETVELDQSKVGRLSRIDALQQQEIAKAQHKAAAEKLTRYQNVLQMLEKETEEFGYCILCDDLIPFKRLCLRPESRICVPCLN